MNDTRRKDSLNIQNLQVVSICNMMYERYFDLQFFEMHGS